MKSRIWLSLMLITIASNPANAQWTGSINWGFMRANAIYLEPSLSDFRSGTTWLYGDIDLGYNTNENLSIHFGVGGYTADSSVNGQFQGVPFTADIEATVLTVPIFIRYSFSDKSEKVRAFIEAGPSISSIEADITASVIGFSDTESGEDERFGGCIGIGFAAKFGSRYSIIPRVRYNYISQASGATFDPSHVTATIGIGF